MPEGQELSISPVLALKDWEKFFLVPCDKGILEVIPNLNVDIEPFNDRLRVFCEERQIKFFKTSICPAHIDYDGLHILNSARELLARDVRLAVRELG